jgi:hypothetical protein
MTSKLLLPQQPVTAKGDAPSRDLVEIIQRIVADLDAAASGTSLAALDGRVTTLEGYRRAVPLATKTASASATMDFTEFDNAVYRSYLLDLTDIKPATNNVTLQGRVSTNGGSSYDSGASDYGTTGFAQFTGAPAGFGAATAAQIQLSGTTDVGNGASSFGYTGQILILNASLSGTQTRVYGDGSYDNGAGNQVMVSSRAKRLTAQDTDAFRIFFSSGNIASGVGRLYGLT